jgi:hypothetical protein
LATSRLYGDHLRLRELEPTISTRATTDKPCGDRVPLEIEFSIRAKLEKRLESCPCWSEFDPNNEFFEENGLRSKEDYLFSLCLHLPEIYHETSNVEASVREVLDQGFMTDANLGELLVGVAHAAHHISYGRHALEILSEEHTWWLWSRERF